MFNVGEGEAILIVFPDKRAWLVDGGCTNSVGPNARLAQLLQNYLESNALTLFPGQAEETTLESTNGGLAFVVRVAPP